jgi:hypothetical protein
VAVVGPGFVFVGPSFQGLGWLAGRSPGQVSLPPSLPRFFGAGRSSPLHVSFPPSLPRFFGASRSSPLHHTTYFPQSKSAKNARSICSCECLISQPVFSVSAGGVVQRQTHTWPIFAYKELRSPCASGTVYSEPQCA